MGKSTAQGFLVKRGLPVIDTDAIARELVQPGQPALAEIVRVFGPRHLTDAGELKRGSLGEIVFHDSGARQQLEAILHPRIRDRWTAAAAAWRSRKVPCGAVVIPLLFETKAESSFDLTVCVACSEPTQLERLAKRGWGESESRRRIGAQMAIRDKMARADRVVWTEGALNVHAEQWDHVLNGWL